MHGLEDFNDFAKLGSDTEFPAYKVSLEDPLNILLIFVAEFFTHGNIVISPIVLFIKLRKVVFSIGITEENVSRLKSLEN